MFNVKRILASFSVAAIMTSTFAFNISADTYHFRGDVNSDGYVNEDDYTVLSDYLLKKEVQGITLQTADLNCDGEISAADMVTMRRILGGSDKQTLFFRKEPKEFKPGERFLENDKYYAVMQHDGNVVVYKKAGGHGFNTATNYWDDFKDYGLRFQEDGNIVLYGAPNYPGAARRAIWNSRTYATDKNFDKPYELSFDNDGNLLLNGQNGLLWKSTTKYNPSPLTNEERRMVALERMQNNYQYSTVEKAAIDFIFYFNPFSKKEQREYGTSINRVTGSDGKDKYVIHIDFNDLEHFKGPYRPDDEAEGTGPIIDFFDNSVAWVHTHGHEVVPANNWFSVKDDNPYDNAFPDCQYSIENKCDGYLGAPNGDIRVFYWETDPIPLPENQSQAGHIIMTGAPN